MRLKIMKKMKTNNLPYPFNVAFDRGDSIDYRTNGGDHDYVRNLGYEPEMLSDCSYHAKGLNGFSLSSYGDWGTFHTNWAGEKEKEMFLDMFEKGIIKLWRIRAYVNGVMTDYDGNDWSHYDKEMNGWVSCKDPYRK
jgi:hypothetical protein